MTASAPAAPSTTSLTSRDRARIVTASTVGTTIEFYDFYVYATAAVAVFPHLFFPKSGNPTVGLLASFATFGLAFLARPLGSIVFGHFGDVVGRKATLVFALLTMGIATFLSLFPVMCPVVPAVGLAQWAEAGMPGASGAKALGWLLCALAVCGAVPAFALVYRRMLPWGPPAPLAATCWIPLGIVGQSVVAVVTLGGPRAYGWAVLALGLPLALWAAWRHWGSLPGWAPYNPTWWASTFPVATCGAGAYALSGGQGWWAALSLGLLFLLAAHWCVAAVRAASWRFKSL